MCLNEPNEAHKLRAGSFIINPFSSFPQKKYKHLLQLRQKATSQEHNVIHL